MKASLGMQLFCGSIIKTLPIAAGTAATSMNIQCVCIQGEKSSAAHPQVQAIDKPATAAGRAQRHARQLQQRRARAWLHVY